MDAWKKLGRAAGALVALLLVAACNVRSCACVTRYEPERAIADLDPFEVQIHGSGPEATARQARMTFLIGGDQDAAVPCGKLPASAVVTWNGIKGTITNPGGSTISHADTICEVVTVIFASATQPPVVGPRQVVTVFDGKAALDVTVPAGVTELRSPTLRILGAQSSELVLEQVGLEGTITEPSASITVPGSGTSTPLLGRDMKVEGRRVILSMPAFWLKESAYELSFGATLLVEAKCTPARAKGCRAVVTHSAKFAITVAR